MPSPHEPVFSPGAAGGRHAKAAGVSEPEPCGQEPPLFTHPGQAGKDKQRKRQRSGGGDRARGGLSPAPSARHRAAAAAPAQEHPGAARVASSHECPRRAPPLPRLPIPSPGASLAVPSQPDCRAYKPALACLRARQMSPSCNPDGSLYFPAPSPQRSPSPAERNPVFLSAGAPASPSGARCKSGNRPRWRVKAP